MSECKFYDNDGNEILDCTYCGIEISPHNFVLEDTCVGEHYVVQVLKCKECGTLSFGYINKEEIEE